MKINWFLLYKILFKNILSSKEIIPIEELNLRFNIIRTSLPKYYKGYKGNNSNSSAIIKKFTYHIYKNKSRSKSLFKIGLKTEEKSKIINTESKARQDKSTSFGKSKSNKINKINLGNITMTPNNKKILSNDSIKFKNINNFLSTDNSKEDKDNYEGIVFYIYLFFKYNFI